MNMRRVVVAPVQTATAAQLFSPFRMLASLLSCFVFERSMFCNFSTVAGKARALDTASDSRVVCGRICFFLGIFLLP